jgi:hypothetical protein
MHWIWQSSMDMLASQVSILHWPAALSYSLPTLAFIALSYFLFKPKLGKLAIYWLVGFAAYLVIHVAI